MKNLVIAALMATAIAVVTLGRGEELCADGHVGESSFPLAAGPALTVTNCAWGAETTFEVNSTATSLSISGGSTVGAIVLVLRPFNAFDLAIKKAFTVRGGLSIRGELPANSTVTITGSIFKLTYDMPSAEGRAFTPARFGGGPLLHLPYLDVSGSKLVVSNNVFEADTTGYKGVQALTTPYSTGLATVTFSDNLFNASGTSGGFTGISNSYVRFANSVFSARSNTFVSSGASCTGVYMEVYSYFYDSKSFKKQSNKGARGGRRQDREGRLRDRRSAAPTEPNARQFAANAEMDWSEVSDEVARTVYGKSTFEITDNVFADIESPWDLREYDGSDWKIEGNTAASTRVSIEGYYNYYGVLFPISITINKNTIAVTEDQTASIAVDFNMLPAKSSLYIAQNTMVTGVQSEVYAVRLGSNSAFPNTTVVSISQNEIVSYNGTTGLAAERWMVYYSGGSRYYYYPADLSMAGHIAMCDNTLFGTKLDTDALANSTFGYRYVPLPLVPVSECSAYTLPPSATVNAAPEHRWSMAFIASLVALAACTLV